MSIFDRGPRGNVPTPFASAGDDASAVGYSNPLLVGNWNGNVQLALDYLLNAVYPNYKGTVANFAALPTNAAANDFYIVVDDGDGKSAGYVYSIIQGVTQWIKRYDVDWSYEQVLADTITRTSYMYSAKYGTTDKDAQGNAITGIYAGQRFYGGDSTGQNLTLTANAIDLTGFVQSDDTLRPTITNTLDLGTSALEWRSGYFGTSVLAGTATLAAGSLTDSGGALSFGSNNLTTTGTLSSGDLSVDSTLVLKSGSIIDTTGTISFGTNALTTSGSISAASGSKLGNITFTAGTFATTSTAFSFSNQDIGSIGTLTASTLSATTLDVGSLILAGATIQTTSNSTSLILQAGSGGNLTTMQLNSKAQLNFDAAISGALVVSGSADSSFAGALQIGTALKLTNAKIQSLAGDIQLAPFGNVSLLGNLVPDADNTRDLGTTALRFDNLFLGTAIGDGTNLMSVSTLMSLRDINASVNPGDIITWNGSKWVTESTSGVIDHTTLTNLTNGDAGHTQFALLAGRAGGQTLFGGTAASQNLTLDSTAHATKGFVLVSSNLAPTLDAAYSSGWIGTDLGSASRNFNNIYSKGIHFGLRFDQYSSSAAYPSNSGQNVGRVIFDTSLNQLLVDNGSTWSKIGNQKYATDTTWDGSTTTKSIDVSAVVSDARNAIWQLCDNTNGYERMFVKITTTQTLVTITVAPALPAGSYRLLGIN